MRLAVIAAVGELADPLLAKIASKRAELVKLDRQRETLMIEIKAYEDAARIVGLHPHQSEGVLHLMERGRPSDARRRARGLSPMWSKVIGRLSDDPHRHEFSYDDILEAGRQLGHEIKRNVARSQMKIYTDAGYVDRITSGRFVVTDKGREAAYTDKNEAPPQRGGAPNSTAEERPSGKELFGTVQPPTPGRTPG